MRLDIGIASYQNAQYLNDAIESIKATTQSDWRLFITDNNSPDPAVREILEAQQSDERIEVALRQNNIGYAGAVNSILSYANNNGTPYVAYCDSDARMLTDGWDLQMIELLETHFEIAMAFPGTYVSYPIERSDYTEILWGIGCFWMLKTARLLDVGYFDTNLGHQEEVDYQQRIHMAGWKIGALRSVQITHVGSSSASPEARERINSGVIHWVDKWNRILHGPHVNYYSPNVTRFEDWNALYLEEWYQLQPELQELNDDPETVFIAALGREVDLIKVPRFQNLYRKRII